jgi:hypothetical protein
MFAPILVVVSILSAQLSEATQQQVDEYIREQADSTASFEQRLRKTVLDSVGTPYYDGPLGEGPHGTHDTDPLIDFGRADCVTFVEQSISVAASLDYDSMFSLLQRIRYRDGQIGFDTRNHYFIADWIANNRFCTDITRDLGAPTIPVTRNISRKYFFELVEAPEFGRDIPDDTITLHVIPPEHVADAVSRMPDSALVVFVGKVDWLFALHCGLHIRADGGEAFLYHASSKAGEVVGMALEDYLREQQNRYIGIAVYRVNSPRATEK